MRYFPVLFLLLPLQLQAQARVSVNPHRVHTAVTGRNPATCTVYRSDGSIVVGAACTWTVRKAALAVAVSPAAKTTTTAKALGTTYIVARYGTRKPDSLRFEVVKITRVMVTPDRATLTAPE